MSDDKSTPATKAPAGDPNSFETVTEASTTSPAARASAQSTAVPGTAATGASAGTSSTASSGSGKSAQQMADETKRAVADEAAGLTAKAKAQAAGLASRAQGMADDKLDEYKDQATSRIEETAEHIRNAGHEFGDDSYQAQAADYLASNLTRAADMVRNQSLGSLTDDVIAVRAFEPDRVPRRRRAARLRRRAPDEGVRARLLRVLRRLPDRQLPGRSLRGAPGGRVRHRLRPFGRAWGAALMVDRVEVRTADGETRTAIDARPEGAQAKGPGSIISDVLTHVSSLIRKEVDLARAEMSENATKAGVAVGLLAGALIVALVALNVLAAALVAALSEVMDAGWAALIVGVVFAVIAAIMVSKGINDLKASSLAPTRTVKNVRRDAEAVKEAL